MADLSIAILGLGKLGTSIGLCLKEYMAKGGEHRFNIVGYDSNDAHEKAADKLGAVDKIQRKIFDAVRDVDIVVLAVPYEDVESAYQLIEPDLRDGVVILDLSPIIVPSLGYAKKYLKRTHHVVGFTPMVNPRYLYDNDNATSSAEPDIFQHSTIYIAPSVTCIPDAIDLAVNFADILGATSHFLDPHEHDVLMTYTESLPSLIGTLYFFSMVHSPAWNDMQRLTNPAFGVLTQHLFHTHPDALRDQWLSNKENILRSLDDLIQGFQSARERFAEEDSKAIEDMVVGTAETYEKWYNLRYNNEWDRPKQKKMDVTSNFMGSILGGKLTDRFFGNQDEDTQ